MEAPRRSTGHCIPMVIQMSDNDIIHRRALYAIGVLSKEELDEIAKANEAAAAAEEDEDDEWSWALLIPSWLFREILIFKSRTWWATAAGRSASAA